MTDALAFCVSCGALCRGVCDATLSSTTGVGTQCTRQFAESNHFLERETALTFFNALILFIFLSPLNAVGCLTRLIYFEHHEFSCFPLSNVIYSNFESLGRLKKPLGHTCKSKAPLERTNKTRGNEKLLTKRGMLCTRTVMSSRLKFQCERQMICERSWLENATWNHQVDIYDEILFVNWRFKSKKKKSFRNSEDSILPWIEFSWIKAL